MRLRSASLVLSIVAATTIAHADDDVAALRARADAEMVEGRFAEAAADYGAAYGLAPDPELLQLIGNANEKLGDCETARTNYRRYLAAARPTADVEASINGRIARCGAAAPSPPVATEPLAPQPTAVPTEPPPFRAGKQFMLGFGLGLGMASHSGNVCACEADRQGTTLGLYVGLLRSPRFAVVAALMQDNQLLTASRVPLVHQGLRQRSVLVGVRGWANRRWWVDGMAGFAKASVSVPQYIVGTPPDGYYESSGALLAVAVGTELVSRESFALSARGRLAAGAYSDVSAMTMTLGLAIDLFP